MRPFVESVSSSRTRRELLRVRAKKDYHLEGLQAQTLAPDLAGQQIRGFVLRCDVSIIIYLKSYQVYELYFVSGRLIDGNRFRGYRHRALQCDSTPFVQCTEDGAVRVWYPSAGKSWMQFRVGYYLFAILFLMFEVETVFLFPWAVITRELGVAGLFSVLFFLIILILGLAYAWRKGALEWK